MLTRRAILSLLIFCGVGSANGQQAFELPFGLGLLNGHGESAPTCSEADTLLTVSGEELAAALTVTPGVRATDGTYTGTTSQGRAIQVVISSNQATQFTISYSCPGRNPGWTSNQTCPISSDTFTCSGGGSVGVCTFGVFEYDLIGTVDSATTISGTFDILDADGMPTYPCCSLNLTWSASVPGPPADPSGLTATGYTTPKVDLAWTDNGTDETEYRVERKLASDVSFTQIATLAADATSHTDEDVNKGMSYVYRVLACNDNGCSNPSNEASVTVPAIGFFIGD